MTNLNLTVLPDKLAIARLEIGSPVPEWALRGDFFSVTRTGEELSLVCAEGNIPAGVKVETGWRALKVLGPLDFSLTGILAALAKPLAEAGVSIFAVSTFDTDYILIKDFNLETAVAALSREGYVFL